MSKHTPGPWETKVIDTSCGEPAYWHIVQRGKNGVIGDVQSVNFADARLMAAAPIMSETLKRAAHILAELHNQLPEIIALRSQIVECIKQATPEHYGIKS